jgi:hypothetical protein
MRFLGLTLVIAACFATIACASKSSSNASNQTSAAATAAAQPAAAATGAPAASEIPSYPGAATQASGTSSNMGQSASGTVMSTDDSFDKVYAWYQQHMPAGSEKSHTTAPVESAVFMIGDPSSGQKSVTLTVSNGKTMISIATVKT